MRNLAVPQEKGKGEIKEGNEESGQIFFMGLFMERLYQLSDSNKHG